MPYVALWDEFAEKARALHESDPVNCRLTMKYRHADGKLVVKATNNVQSFQYLAEQQKEVKNIDKFMSSIMRSMVGQ